MTVIVFLYSICSLIKVLSNNFINILNVFSLLLNRKHLRYSINIFKTVAGALCYEPSQCLEICSGKDEKNPAGAQGQVESGLGEVGQ